MNPRADPTVGTPAARARTTTRRGTPWQDRSPSQLWPAASAVIPVLSQGNPPAHRPAPPRRVVPTHPGPHPTPLADRPSPTASRTVRVPALTRPPAPRVVTVRATDACPAPAGKPATQPTNQNSTQVVLDNAVPHQLFDEHLDRVPVDLDEWHAAEPRQDVVAEVAAVGGHL